MATIIMVHTLIPKKPTNYLSNSSLRKVSLPCSVNSSAAATKLKPCSVRCTAEIRRRSGNYNTSFWDFNYIQSLGSEYTEERYLKGASKLKMQVMMLLEEEILMGPLQKLELIDDLQRMAISYHFEDKIEQILSRVYEEKYCKNYEPKERDLYSTALEFRLLRQHGFSVSQEVFECFKNEKGEFKPSLSDDVKGLQCLYEASFLLTEGEYTLELAKEFAKNFLQKILDEGIDENLALLVKHALELPIHWRINRPNARWFIDAYGRRPDMNPAVLEFAKLDFNIVQAEFQQELKHVSRWWKNTCLAEKLPFARDRVVECYLLANGYLQGRQYGYQRIMTTTLVILIILMDDIFDIYGTLEELQLFTDAVQRWDTESMNRLPKYMQIYYLAMFNFANEMAYHVLKEQGFIITPYLRKSWTDLILSFLQEAEWYHSGQKPSLEEYLNNAWITVSSPITLSHIYFLATNSIEKDTAECLHKYHDIVRWSGMIFRLADDMGTSSDEMKRGDVPKSIQCHMNEKGVSEKEAQEHVRFLMGEAWKNMNKEAQVASSTFPQDLITSAADIGRIGQYVFHDGDGFGVQYPKAKDLIGRFLFEPIV